MTIKKYESCVDPGVYLNICQGLEFKKENKTEILDPCFVNSQVRVTHVPKINKERNTN